MIPSEMLEKAVKISEEKTILKNLPHYTGLPPLAEMADKIAKIESLFTDYKHDFIIQKILTQCEEFAELNKSSINTIRIISYLNSEGVIPLSSVMRIGKEGHFADNMSLGGTAWGIDDNGKIKSYGIDEFGNRLTEFKNGESLEGYPIPGYDDAVELVKKVHKNIYSTQR